MFVVLPPNDNTPPENTDTSLCARTGVRYVSDTGYVSDTLRYVSLEYRGNKQKKKILKMETRWIHLGVFKDTAQLKLN